MSSQFPHLLPVFLLEAEHCLADLGSAVARLANDLEDTSSWRAVARAALSVREGGAARAGCAPGGQV